MNSAIVRTGIVAALLIATASSVAGCSTDTDSAGIPTGATGDVQIAPSPSQSEMSNREILKKIDQGELLNFSTVQAADMAPGEAVDMFGAAKVAKGVQTALDFDYQVGLHPQLVTDQLDDRQTRALLVPWMTGETVDLVMKNFTVQRDIFQRVRDTGYEETVAYFKENPNKLSSEAIGNIRALSLWGMFEESNDAYTTRADAQGQFIGRYRFEPSTVAVTKESNGEKRLAVTIRTVTTVEGNATYGIATAEQAALPGANFWGAASTGERVDQPTTQTVTRDATFYLTPHPDAKKGWLITGWTGDITKSALVPSQEKLPSQPE